MTTASNDIKTNSINAITASSGAIDIGASQTSGALNIGTGSRTSAGTINIGSATNSATVFIETNSTKNTYADPAVRIGVGGGTKTIRLGNFNTTITNGVFNFLGANINLRTATNAITIASNQTNGSLNIATASSRSGSISIANGATTSSALNIHNGAGSSGSVNIANGAQSTTVGIQSGTGTGTVTIGNANNIVALNGQTNLARPLGLSSTLFASLATQLGFRSLTEISGTYTTSTTNTEEAKSFTFDASGVWFVELRCRVNTVSVSQISLNTTSAVLNSERLIVNNIAVVGQSISLSTTIVEPNIAQTWYVNVKSDVAITAFIDFTLFATRIG